MGPVLLWIAVWQHGRKHVRSKGEGRGGGEVEEVGQTTGAEKTGEPSLTHETLLAQARKKAKEGEGETAWLGIPKMRLGRRGQNCQDG